MPAQLQLPLEKAPQVTERDINFVITLLRGRGWLTARQIADTTNFLLAYPAKNDPPRFIRAIANASGARILSYPGSPGYRLRDEATEEERETAKTKLTHQAQEMLARAALI